MKAPIFGILPISRNESGTPKGAYAMDPVNGNERCSVRRFLTIISGLSLIILLTQSQSAGGRHRSQSIGSDGTDNEATTDSAWSDDPLREGPHVFWRTDSSAIVFYLCNGTVERRIIQVVDTLRFNGFCGDSGIEYVIPTTPAAVEPHIFDNVSRIMAVSDIHGEYGHLVDILAECGIIDDDGHWTWGQGHLVIVGDVFDRGDRVTECLWFIHRLERDAKQRGGRVHFTLGNHETMVLTGDNRYVNEKYMKGIARKSRIKHEDLYGLDMELGRWLRSKHTAIKINDIIFTHAGIPPYLMDWYPSLAVLNEAVRNSIDLSSSQVAFDETLRLLYGGKGPFWYRGYHYEMEGRYPMVRPDEVDSILSHYGASAIVVGHSEVDSVLGLFDNRVIAIDVPVEELGNLQVLLWEDGRFYRVTGTGELQPIE